MARSKVGLPGNRCRGFVMTYDAERSSGYVISQNVRSSAYREKSSAGLRLWQCSEILEWFSLCVRVRLCACRVVSLSVGRSMNSHPVYQGGESLLRSPLLGG